MRIGRFVVLVCGEHVGHRGSELVDVPVGVDVAGLWIEACPSSFWTALRLPVASSTRWPAVWRLLCIFSPLVVPGATMPAVARQRYHQSCAAWPLIGFSG